VDVTYRGKAECPPRVLEYRNQIKILAVIAKYFVYVYFLLCLCGIVFCYLNYRESKDFSKLMTGLYVNLFLNVIIYLEYFFLLRPLALTKIQVFEDRLFIKRGSKEIIVPFEDIVEIKSSVNKWLGGWFKLILKDKKAHRFTVVLNRSDYILDAVIKFNSKLLEEKKYIDLRTKLILIDHNFSRMNDILWRRFPIISFSHLVVLPLAFFTMLYLKQNNQFIIYNPFDYFMYLCGWTLIYMGVLLTIFPTIMNTIIEKQTMKKMALDTEDKMRDIQYESKIYKRLFPAYLALLIAFFAGVYKYDLNTLNSLSVSRNHKDLNIKAGEELWFDSRYNCTDCHYKLSTNDLVFTSVGLGKIVALPDQQVTININKKDNLGRSIASVEEKLVPQKSMAIKTSRGETIIVENKDIRGKVFREIPHLK
jgi:hypothetical protein